MPSLRRRLRSLKLNRVALVPAGANPDAHITLFKNDGNLSTEPSKVPDDLPKETAVSEIPEETQAELDRLKSDAEERAAELKRVKADLDTAQSDLAKAKEEPGEDDPVRKELDETREKLAKIEAERREERFVAKAKAYEKLGPPEKVAKWLMAADEHFEDEEKADFEKFLAGTAQQVEKGELFSQFTRPSAEVEDWDTRLEKLAKERVEKDGSLTVEQAKVAVMEENADIRKEYEKSVRS